METLLRVAVRIVGYAFLGGLAGVPAGCLISFLVGLIFGHTAEACAEGAWIGAALGATTGFLIADPLEVIHELFLQTRTVPRPSVAEQSRSSETPFGLRPKDDVARLENDAMTQSESTTAVSKPVVLFLF